MKNKVKVTLWDEQFITFEGDIKLNFFRRFFIWCIGWTVEEKK